jgi:hypothetical protein
LKKILIYSAVAVVLGLLLTLVPLFTLAEFKTENHYVITPNVRNFVNPEIKEATNYSVFGFEILAISFTVALVAYVLLKLRMPH